MAAMDVLHDKGCPIVVISSSELGGNDSLIALGSKATAAGRERVRIEIPKFPARYALFL